MAADPVKAARLYIQGGEGGNADAMNRAGMCFAEGKGVEKDVEAAARWYHKAASAGSAPGMYNLGLCYAQGAGVKANERLAMQWLGKSADRGFEPAKREVAAAREKGTSRLMALAALAAASGALEGSVSPEDAEAQERGLAVNRSMEAQERAKQEAAQREENNRKADEQRRRLSTPDR